MRMAFRKVHEMRHEISTQAKGIIDVSTNGDLEGQHGILDFVVWGREATLALSKSAPTPCPPPQAPRSLVEAKDCWKPRKHLHQTRTLGRELAVD